MQKKKIKRVYIAGMISPKGAHSTNLAIDYLINVRKMIRAGIAVFLAGYDPFIPALDFGIFLLLREDRGERITEQMIKRYSKSWLEACEAVLLVPGWKKSAGTAEELKLAEELGIPVFEDVVNLTEHDNENTD